MAASEESCEGNPDFAIICSFITKFGSDCGVNLSISYLKELLEDTKNVREDLAELIIHLLRRGRKRVTKEKWEKSLIKFCHEYSSVDAWELERFGYKKAKLSIKIELLKRLLELQFDSNVKFKTEVNKQDASSLRIPPIGRDIDGHVYWYQLDKDHNMRLYRQGAEDENEWQLLCSTTDELKNLLGELQKNNYAAKKEEGAEETKETSENATKVETDGDDMKACSISETKPNTIIIKTERKDSNMNDVNSTKMTEDSKPSTEQLSKEKSDEKQTESETVKVEDSSMECDNKVTVKIEDSDPEKDKTTPMEVDGCQVITQDSSTAAHDDVEMTDSEEIKVENKSDKQKECPLPKPSEKESEISPVTSIPEKLNLVKPLQKFIKETNESDKNLTTAPLSRSEDSCLTKLQSKESPPAAPKKGDTPNKIPSPSIESPSKPNFKGGKIKLYERWNNQKKQAAALALNLDQHTACDLSSSSQANSVPEAVAEDLSADARKTLQLKSPSKTRPTELSSAPPREEFPMDLSMSHRSSDSTSQTKVNTSSSGGRIDFNNISNLSKSSIDCNGNKDRPSHITSSPMSYKAINPDFNSVPEAPRPLKKKHMSLLKDEHSNQNSEHLRKSVIFEVKNSKLNQYEENQTSRESIYTSKVSTGSSFSHLQALQNMCDTNMMMNVSNSVIHPKNSDKNLNFTNASSKVGLNASEKSFNDNYCDNLSKRYNFNSAQVLDDAKSGAESTDSSVLLKSNVALQNSRTSTELYQKCSSLDPSKTNSNSSVKGSSDNKTDCPEVLSQDKHTKFQNAKSIKADVNYPDNLPISSAEIVQDLKTGSSFDKITPNSSFQEQDKLKQQSKLSTKGDKLDMEGSLTENLDKITPKKCDTSFEEQNKLKKQSKMSTKEDKLDKEVPLSENLDKITPNRSDTSFREQNKVKQQSKLSTKGDKMDKEGPLTENLDKITLKKSDTSFEEQNKLKKQSKLSTKKDKLDEEVPLSESLDKITPSPFDASFQEQNKLKQQFELSTKGDKEVPLTESLDKITPNRSDAFHEQNKLKQHSKLSTKGDKLDKEVPLSESLDALKKALTPDEKINKEKESRGADKNVMEVSTSKLATLYETKTSTKKLSEDSSIKETMPILSEEKTDKSLDDHHPSKILEHKKTIKESDTLAPEIQDKKSTDKKLSVDEKALEAANAGKSLKPYAEEGAKQTPDDKEHMNATNIQNLSKKVSSDEEHKSTSEGIESKSEISVPNANKHKADQHKKDESILAEDCQDPKLSETVADSSCDVEKCVKVADYVKSATAKPLANEVSKNEKAAEELISDSSVTSSNIKHKKMEIIQTTNEDDKKTGKIILTEDLAHSVSESEKISVETTADSLKTSTGPILPPENENMDKKSITEPNETECCGKIEKSDSSTGKKSLPSSCIPEDNDSDNAKSLKETLKSTNEEVILKSLVLDIQDEKESGDKKLENSEKREIVNEPKSCIDKDSEVKSLSTENNNDRDDKKDTQCQVKIGDDVSAKVSQLEKNEQQNTERNKKTEIQKQTTTEAATHEQEEITDIGIKEKNDLSHPDVKEVPEDKAVKEGLNDIENVKHSNSKSLTNKEHTIEKDAKQNDEHCIKSVAESINKNSKNMTEKSESKSLPQLQPLATENTEASVTKLQNEENLGEKNCNTAKEASSDVQPKTGKQTRGRKKRIFTPRKNRRRANLKNGPTETNVEVMDIDENITKVSDNLSKNNEILGDKKTIVLNSDEDSSESELNLMALMKKSSEKKSLSKDETTFASDENKSKSKLDLKSKLPPLRFDLHCIRNSLCLETKVKRVSFSPSPAVSLKKLSSPFLLTTFSMDTTDDIEIVEEKINVNALKKKKGRLRAPLKTVPVKAVPQPKKVPPPPPKASPRKRTPKSTQFSSGDGEKQAFSIPEGFLEILSSTQADKQTSKPAKIPRARSRIEDLAPPSQQSSDGESSAPIKRSRRIREQTQKKISEFEREQRMLVEQLAKKNTAKKVTPQKLAAAVKPLDTKSPRRSRTKLKTLVISEEDTLGSVDSKRTPRKSRSRNAAKMALMFEEDTKSSEFSNSRDAENKEKRRRRRGRPSRRGAGHRPWDVSSESSTTIEEITEEEEEEEQEEPLIFEVNEDEFACEEIDENAEPVFVRRARTAKKAPEEAAEETVINDDTPCIKCGKYDRPEWILLCDKCDSGYHTTCLIPPLLIIPDGDWYCQPCEHMFLCECLQKELYKLELVLKQKEREELRKQRLAYVGISLDNVLKPEKKEKSEESSRSEDDGEDEEEVVEQRRSKVKSKEVSSDDEKHKKLYGQRSVRARRTVNYQFKEYDELIASAIQEDMLDIGVPLDEEFKDSPKGEDEAESEKSFKAGMRSRRKKRSRKLNDLDFSDDEDDSGEEYKGQSTDSEPPPSTNESGAESAASGEWRIVKTRGKKQRRKPRRGGYSSEEDWEENESDTYRPVTRRAAQKAISYREISSDDDGEWNAPKAKLPKKRKKTSTTEEDSESSFKKKPAKRKSRVRKWASSESSESENVSFKGSDTSQGGSEDEWKIKKSYEGSRLKININKKVLSSESEEESSSRESVPKKKSNKVESDEEVEESEEEEEEEEEDEEEEESSSGEEEGAEDDESEEEAVKPKSAPESKPPFVKEPPKAELVKKPDPPSIAKVPTQVETAVDATKVPTAVARDKPAIRTIKKDATKMVPCVIPYVKSPKSGHATTPDEESDKEIPKEKDSSKLPFTKSLPASASASLQPSSVPPSGSTNVVSQPAAESRPFVSTIMEPFSNMDEESEDSVPLERIPTSVPPSVVNKPRVFDQEYIPAKVFPYSAPEEKSFPPSYSSLAPFAEFSSRPSPLKPSLVETYSNNSSPSKLTPLDTTSKQLTPLDNPSKFTSLDNYSRSNSPRGFVNLDYSEGRKKKHFYGSSAMEAEVVPRPVHPSSDSYQGEIRFPPEPYPCPQSPNSYTQRSSPQVQRDPGTPPRFHSQYSDSYAPPRSPEYYQSHQYYGGEERIPRPPYQPNYVAPEQGPPYVPNPYVATPVPQPNGGFMIDSLLQGRNPEDELTEVTDIVSYITQEK